MVRRVGARGKVLTCLRSPTRLQGPDFSRCASLAAGGADAAKKSGLALRPTGAILDLPFWSLSAPFVAAGGSMVELPRARWGAGTGPWQSVRQTFYRVGPASLISILI